MSEGINLLDPNKDSSSIVPVKRMQTMRVFAGGLLFIVSVTSIIVFLLVALSPLPELQRQEQEDRATLMRADADIAKIELLNERATAVQGILTKRKSFDATLDFILSQLPTNATISSIKVEDGNVSLTIQSKSLQSLDTFLNSMVQSVIDKKIFSKVTLTSLINDDTNNSYAMTISLLTL